MRTRCRHLLMHCLLQCVLISYCNAQGNLIKNGGFEDIFGLPRNDKNLDFGQFGNFVKDWFTTGYSSADLYSSLQKDSCHLSSPTYQFYLYDIAPDSLKYFPSKNIHTNSKNFTALANMDSASPYIPHFSWGKENICQDGFNLKKFHKYKIGFSYTQTFSNTYLARLNFVFTPGAFNTELRQYKIQNFKQGQSVDFDLKNTLNWDSVQTTFVARNKHQTLFIGSIDENNKILNMPHEYTKYFGYYSYMFIDNIYMYEIPCIVGPDSLCLGQTDTLSTTLKGPWKWSLDPEAKQVFSYDSIVLIKVDAPAKTIYCHGVNGIDSMTIYGIRVNKPQWADTFHLCDHTTMQLSAGTTQYHYEWNTGGKTPVQKIDAEGEYKVRFNNYLGCYDSSDTYVKYHFIPKINLRDTFVNCFVDRPIFELAVSSDSFTCYWENHPKNTCLLQTDNPGKYKLMVMSKSSQCTNQKSIVVKDVCDPLVFVPNVFRPGSEIESNHQFLPLIKYTLSYQMCIYNRWGELVWSTNNPATAWDGSYMNQPCPEGVYLCTIFVEGRNNQKLYFSNLIQLLR